MESHIWIYSNGFVFTIQNGPASFRLPRRSVAGVFGHSVLATDYESYALAHGCKEIYDEKTDIFDKMVIVQIWSRSKTIDEGLLKTLKSLMSGLDIADTEWEDISNDSC
jgi:hypothetical protein